jgi:DNA repair protein RecO (recombination protein O)
MLMIILSRKNFREYDQIVSFYTTEFGKLEVLAKGIKKITSKQSGYLEPFSLVEAEMIYGKEINRLVKVQPIEVFKNIRQNLQKSMIVGSIVDLVDKLLRTGEKDERIFYLLKAWLEYIEKIDVVNKGLLYAFIVSLFHFLGFAPELYKCIGCGKVKKENIGFDIKNGGLVCGVCGKDNPNIQIKEIYPIDLEEIKYFKILLSGNWQEISKLDDEKKVFNLIYKFCQFHSDGKIVNFFNFIKYL